MCVNLTNDALGYYGPVWSPDGDEVAFGGTSIVGYSGIWCNGGGGAENAGGFCEPAFGVYVANADGSAHALLASGASPDWLVSSPGRPLSSFTHHCSGSACDFDGSGSSDSDGTIASYTWQFGDGTSGSGPTPRHVYAIGDRYTVTLTVADDMGTTGAHIISDIQRDQCNDRQSRFAHGGVKPNPLVPSSQTARIAGDRAVGEIRRARTIEVARECTAVMGERWYSGTTRRGDQPVRAGTRGEHSSTRGPVRVGHVHAERRFTESTGVFRTSSSVAPNTRVPHNRRPTKRHLHLPIQQPRGPVVAQFIIGQVDGTPARSSDNEDVAGHS